MPILDSPYLSLLQLIELIIDTKSFLCSVILIKPGPAASTISNRPNKLSLSTNFDASSMGFNFKILAATIQTLVVM